jgi:hypothetical protein
VSGDTVDDDGGDGLADDVGFGSSDVKVPMVGMLTMGTLLVGGLRCGR